MFDVSFDNFTTEISASCEPKRQIRRGDLSGIIKINDIESVYSTCNVDIIKQKFEEIIDNPFVLRMMTITLDSSLNPLVEESEAFQRNLLEKCFNTLKKYDTMFVACLEYHKYRPVFHAHVLYKSKNMNRIRLQKKAIKQIATGRNYHNRHSCRDENVNNISKSYEYLIKEDENAIDKTFKNYYFFMSDFAKKISKNI